MKPSPTAARPRAQAAVSSPCINVCRMDPASGLCEGCLRTLDEIAAWGQMTPAQQREVLLSLSQRRLARRRAAAAAAASPGTGPAAQAVSPPAMDPSGPT